MSVCPGQSSIAALTADIQTASETHLTNVTAKMLESFKRAEAVMAAD